MKRNCNLELRLLTPSGAEDKKQQKLTMFYNGGINVCDATELQARAILWVASREVEERSPAGSDGCYSPMMYSPTAGAGAGLSMKGSLKSFLEKRKTRTQATSPYPLPRNFHE